MENDVKYLLELLLTERVMDRADKLIRRWKSNPPEQELPANEIFIERALSDFEKYRAVIIDRLRAAK